jgi:hypothetical protein
MLFSKYLGNLFIFINFYNKIGIWRSLPLVTSFFSVGRSMSHIKNKYGFISAIITHYGITIAGLSLYVYIKNFTVIKIMWLILLGWEIEGWMNIRIIERLIKWLINWLINRLINIIEK